MVWAGGSASRTIWDQGTTDPDRGVVGSRRHQPAWQLLVERGLGPHWTSSAQAFLPLGSHSGMNERCWTALKGCWEVGTLWCRSLRLGWTEALCRWSPRCPELGDVGGGCGLLEGVGRFHKGQRMN